MIFLHKKAFTLIELLVVVTIMALLVSILLPALNKAKESARTILCLSKQRQLSIAAINYSMANDDYYPITGYEKIDENMRISYSWDFINIVYFNNSISNTKTEPGLLWKYCDTPNEVQQCPSYRGASNWLNDPSTGFNYNASYIGGMGSVTGIIKSAKTSQVKHPSQTVIFGDGQYDGGANKFMRAPVWDTSDPSLKDPYFSNSGRAAGTQGFRHGGKSNAAFCDGHVESMKKLYTADYEGLAENTGFLSPDNSIYDLK